MVSPGQGGDITLVRTGAHKISVTPSGQAIKTAGFTHGNLSFTVTVNKRDVLVAEYGTTPADIEITGQRCVVKWTMIERSLKILDIALQGIYPLNYYAATTNRGIGRSGIQRASTRGGTILLHPLSQGAATVQDITLQQAIITPTGNVELSDQGDQLWEVEADCIVSPSASDGELLAIINESNVGV